MPAELKTLDLDAMPSFYETEAAPVRNAGRSIRADYKHCRRVEKRRYLRMQQVGAAADHIGTLPVRGESLHAVMSGSYHLFAIVTAILKLAEPVTMKRLTVGTLSFNKDNAAELLDLIDRGKIAKCDFVCSCYYKSAEPEVFDGFVSEMQQRGQRVVAVRNHAKLLLAEMSDGNAYVVESSANLRSCHNAEQWTMTNDLELLEFHRGWLEEFFEEQA
ncbi:MAG: hypothetical protein IID33_14515 [Planctomycetes bacterium]|nr:hypothetical protein [Planctomycetota bacterium]